MINQWNQILNFIQQQCPSHIVDSYQNLMMQMQKQQSFYEDIFFLKPMYFMNYLSLEQEKEYWWFHCLLLSLFEELIRGNICLYIDGYSYFEKESLLSLQDKEYVQWVENQPLTATLKALVIVKKSNQYWIYFQEQWNTFVKLQKEIQLFLDFIPESHFNYPKSYFDNLPIKLNEKQVSAIHHVLSHHFNIIVGGPGTGKTTVSNFILELLITYNTKTDIRIAMLAPTGKAKVRIQESIESYTSQSMELSVLIEQGALIIQTIHRFLRDREDEVSHLPDIYTSHHIRYQLDVLFIDEISMVSPSLFVTLLSKIHPSCKIILLGDQNQLPSVKEGDLLQYMLKSSLLKPYTSKLKQIFRSEQKSSLQKFIVRLSSYFKVNTQKEQESVFLCSYKNYQGSKQASSNEQINLMEELNLTLFQDHDFNQVLDKEFSQKGAYLLDLKNTKLNHYELLKSIFDYFYIPLYKQSLTEQFLFQEDYWRVLLNITKKIKILTPLKEGLLGVKYINKIFQDLYYSYFQSYTGIPVMVQENLYQFDLFNGDTGVIINIDDGSLRVIFEKSSQLISYDYTTLLPFLEYAFINTIHKSQGSEYNCVFLLIPSYTPHHLLTLSILYTGASRAKNQLIMISEKNILEQAINNQKKRNSGIF